MDERRSFEPRVNLLPDRWRETVRAVEDAKHRRLIAAVTGIGIPEAEEIYEAAIVSAQVLFGGPS